MRILGWILIIIGTLVFARVAWLGAMYFHNMGQESRQRFYISIVVSPLVAAGGAWLACGAAGPPNHRARGK